MGDSALDFRAAIKAIHRTITIIPMGTIGSRTTITLNHIHLFTVATDTPGITGVELTTAIIALITTTAVELT